MTGTDPPEIAISLAWHQGIMPFRFQTQDGRPVEVIHRGTWSHGLGPDFADAMLLFDDREIRAGAVEMHITAHGWIDHGHHLDPRYDAVILHLVLHDDGSVARRSDGATVPVATIDGALLNAVDWAAWPKIDWSQFGGAVCAPALATTDPALLRTAIWHLGDRRLAFRSARLEARLTVLPPAEVLWAELLDGLGYTANRQPMSDVAAALPIGLIEERLALARPADRPITAAALLFGVAGFLPLSPADAAAAEVDHERIPAIEATWAEIGGAWQEATLSPTRWTSARVRPANHPARRLAAVAALVTQASSPGGLLSALLAPLREGHDPIAVLSDLANPPGIGADRAAAIIASGLLPFALALANQTDDQVLADAASRAWESLPAPGSDQVTRRALRQVAGTAGLGRLGARGHQGLHHLDATLCTPRRCYECPIALAVVRHSGTKM